MITFTVPSGNRVPGGQLYPVRVPDVTPVDRVNALGMTGDGQVVPEKLMFRIYGIDE